jgi:hypothetical protein
MFLMVDETGRVRMLVVDELGREGGGLIKAAVE